MQRQSRWQGRPVWGGPGWKVFLYSPEDIRRTIRYIQNNPTKLGLPPQRWGFVKDYDGWPLHKKAALDWRNRKRG